MTIKDELQFFMNAMAVSYSAGDALACAEMFTADAKLISPYAPTARGRKEIEELHKIWTAGVRNKMLHVIEAGGSGDVAWCLANFSEGEVTGEGTSLCVFERQHDSNWLIRICSLNEENS
jgi:ketosteroid isomerase-like protein